MIDEIGEALATGQAGETHPHPLAGEGVRSRATSVMPGKASRKPRKPGSSRRTSIPSAINAGGSAAATSPSPPDLTQG